VLDIDKEERLRTQSSEVSIVTKKILIRTLVYRVSVRIIHKVLRFICLVLYIHKVLRVSGGHYFVEEH
jgi:hypothetical protein